MGSALLVSSGPNTLIATAKTEKNILYVAQRPPIKRFAVLKASHDTLAPQERQPACRLRAGSSLIHPFDFLLAPSLLLPMFFPPYGT